MSTEETLNSRAKRAYAEQKRQEAERARAAEERRVEAERKRLQDIQDSPRGKAARLGAARWFEQMGVPAIQTPVTSDQRECDYEEGYPTNHRYVTKVTWSLEGYSYFGLYEEPVDTKRQATFRVWVEVEDRDRKKIRRFAGTLVALGAALDQEEREAADGRRDSL